MAVAGDRFLLPKEIRDEKGGTANIQTATNARPDYIFTKNILKQKPLSNTLTLQSNTSHHINNKGQYTNYHR